MVVPPALQVAGTPASGACSPLFQRLTGRNLALKNIIMSLEFHGRVINPQTTCNSILALSGKLILEDVT